MPPIILSTGSLYNLDIGTIMATAADVGFAGIELVIDWRWETHRLQHLERLIERHDLPILAIHSPFINVAIQGWPQDPIKRIKQSVSLAEDLGARTVVVHPPERWIRFQAMVVAPQWDQKISLPLPFGRLGSHGQWLREYLPDYQKKISAKVAVENMPCRPFGPIKLEPHHFYTPTHLSQFQYLTLDTTHVGTRSANLLKFYNQLKSKIIHIHLSNYNGREHRLLDDGYLPLHQLLNQLQQDQFVGMISLELNTIDLQSDDLAKLAHNLRQNLEFCQQGLNSSQ